MKAVLSLSPPKPATHGFIEIQSGVLAGRIFPLPSDGGTLWFGRDEGCEVYFEPTQDRTISRRHACIDVLADGVYLRDPGSANGTWLNSTRLDKSTRLRDGDSFRLGGESGPWVTLHLVIEPSPPACMSAPPCGALYRTSPTLAPASSLDDTQLIEGWLGVDAPLEMAVGETALVRAVAVRDALKMALVAGALSQENQQFLAALLGPAVSLKLVSAEQEDFRIRVLTPAKQRVRRNKLAVWEWLITANETGEDKLLLLSVTSLGTVSGHRVGESMPSRQLRIHVKVGGRTSSLVFPTSGLRRLLELSLRSDGDFDAFCLDNFPAIFRRFGGGMDRVAKTNLLLALEKGPAVVASLQKEEPNILDEHAGACALKLVPALPSVQSAASIAQMPPPNFALMEAADTKQKWQMEAPNNLSHLWRDHQSAITVIAVAAGVLAVAMATLGF